jgi:hypothetical protein
VSGKVDQVIYGLATHPIVLAKGRRFGSMATPFLNHMIPTRPIDREKAETEARAKAFWGDSREDVLKFLMMNGINAAEATTLVEGIFQERAEEIRRIGLRKIFIGIALMAVPVVAWFVFMSLHFLPMKLFAVTVMVGLYGTYLLLKGTIMFVSPKSEPGDVGDK